MISGIRYSSLGEGVIAIREGREVREGQSEGARIFVRLWHFGPDVLPLIFRRVEMVLAFRLVSKECCKLVDLRKDILLTSRVVMAFEYRKEFNEFNNLIVNGLWSSISSEMLVEVKVSLKRLCMRKAIMPKLSEDSLKFMVKLNDRFDLDCFNDLSLMQVGRFSRIIGLDLKDLFVDNDSIKLIHVLFNDINLIGNLKKLIFGGIMIKKGVFKWPESMPSLKMLSFGDMVLMGTTFNLPKFLPKLRELSFGWILGLGEIKFPYALPELKKLTLGRVSDLVWIEFPEGLEAIEFRWCKK